MTPLQRELFAASVRDPWRNRFVPLRPRQLAAGSLALTARPLLRTTVKRGGVVSRQTTEPLPPPGAVGLSTPRSSGPQAARRPDVPGTPQEEVVRQPVTEVSFVFRYGSETEDTVRLMVAPVGR
jgi:hypothetical protein